MVCCSAMEASPQQPAHGAAVRNNPFLPGFQSPAPATQRPVAKVTPRLTVTAPVKSDPALKSALSSLWQTPSLSSCKQQHQQLQQQQQQQQQLQQLQKQQRDETLIARWITELLRLQQQDRLPEIPSDDMGPMAVANRPHSELPGWPGPCRSLCLPPPLRTDLPPRVPSPGVPSPGVPSPDAHSPGGPSLGVPSPGLLCSGLPSPRFPSSGSSSPGVPSPGVHSPGLSCPAFPLSPLPSPTAIDEYSRLCGYDASADPVIQRTYHLLGQTHCYYGKLPMEAARRRLHQRPPGSYLLRDSSDPRFLFSLSVKTARGTTSIRLSYAAAADTGERAFALDCDAEMAARMPRFAGVLDLLEYYTQLTRHKENNMCVFLESSGRRDTAVVLSRPCRHSVPSLANQARRTLNARLTPDQRQKLMLFLPPRVEQFLKDYTYSI